MFPATKFFPLLLPLVLATAAQAQTALSPPVASKPASASAVKQWPLVDGEVIEVDHKDKRVLLKHGPIKSIGMDAMTMEFLVSDAKILASLKPGDKVRFAAAWRDGDYVLTRVEVQKRRSVKPSQSHKTP
jgi:Cu(I)/Ag(I) efflux system periplasmic protein CusF